MREAGEVEVEQDANAKRKGAGSEQTSELDDELDWKACSIPFDDAATVVDRLTACAHLAADYRRSPGPNS